jgi:hypothetical protein
MVKFQNLKRHAFVATCFAFAASSALAYRPFNTEDAGVAGEGVLQAEISWDSYHWKDGSSDQVLLLVAPIWGPTEDIELSMETPYVTHKTAEGTVTRGLGDVNLVAKKVIAWERYDSKDALVTLKGYVKLNSGDYARGLGRGDTEYTMGPVLSKIVTENFTVHAQVGYSWVTRKQDPDLRNFGFFGFAADYAITEPFHVVAEYTQNQHPDRGLADQKQKLFGLTYAVTKALSLDVTYKLGIGPTSPDRGFGIGAAIQF